MAKLIIVRHSISQVVEHLPANEWGLSREGMARCKPLAEQLSVYRPARVVASLEPKATQTGQMVAEYLNIPFENEFNLHEHGRRNVPYRRRETFEACVREFFAKPDKLVFGEETADQAYSRFARAVQHVVESHPEQTIVIVTHGTVMSLFVTRHNPQLDPFSLWKSLDMPAYAVLSLPGLVLSALCESLD